MSALFIKESKVISTYLSLKF